MIWKPRKKTISQYKIMSEINNTPTVNIFNDNQLNKWPMPVHINEIVIYLWYWENKAY